jgi:hypothetical protein
MGFQAKFLFANLCKGRKQVPLYRFLLKRDLGVYTEMKLGYKKPQKGTSFEF